MPITAFHEMRHDGDQGERSHILQRQSREKYSEKRSRLHTHERCTWIGMQRTTEQSKSHFSKTKQKGNMPIGGPDYISIHVVRKVFDAFLKWLWSLNSFWRTWSTAWFEFFWNGSHSFQFGKELGCQSAEVFTKPAVGDGATCDRYYPVTQVLIQCTARNYKFCSLLIYTYDIF